MHLLQTVHRTRVHSRRVDVLVRRLSRLIERSSTVLDVGCGDGLLAQSLTRQVPGITVEGVDVLVRDDAAIPVRQFDGDVIPFADNSFDVVMLVDVLHHTVDPLRLLKEAARVSRGAVVIKDHLREGWLATPTLRFMDWVGNAAYGVHLPYNYLTRAQWDAAFFDAGLGIDHWEVDLRLYPRPADYVFGRGLHFMTRLVPRCDR